MPTLPNSITLRRAVRLRLPLMTSATLRSSGKHSTPFLPPDGNENLADENGEVANRAETFIVALDIYGFEHFKKVFEHNNRPHSIRRGDPTPHPIQNSEQLSTNYTNEKLQQEVRIFHRCTRALFLIIIFTGKSVQRPRVRIGARGMRNPTKGFCRIAQRLDSRRDAVAKKKLHNTPATYSNGNVALSSRQFPTSPKRVNKC